MKTPKALQWQYSPQKQKVLLAKATNGCAEPLDSARVSECCIGNTQHATRNRQQTKFQEAESTHVTVEL